MHQKQRNDKRRKWSGQNPCEDYQLQTLRIYCLIDGRKTGLLVFFTVFEHKQPEMWHLPNKQKECDKQNFDHHLRKNDLKWYSEAYVKYKETLRDHKIQKKWNFINLIGFNAISLTYEASFHFYWFGKWIPA